MNGTEANEFAQALDRRLTEGLNLLHGRLDILQEDVRENRRDIKELRKELWDGLKEAAAERANLATRTDLAALGESQNQFRAEVAARFGALKESNRQILAIVSRIQERSEATAWTRRRIVVAVAGGISLLVIGALLQPLLERVAAALFGG